MQFLLRLYIYVLVGSICRAALCPSRAILSIDKHFIYLVQRDEQMEKILLLLILGTEATKKRITTYLQTCLCSYVFSIKTVKFTQLNRCTIFVVLFKTLLLKLAICCG
jgi:hypothetical protein